MNNKKSFVVYSSWRSYFDLLDKSDQVKELLTAMFDLADGNEPNVTDDKVKIAYEAISQVMRKDIALYHAKCEKNKKAAEVRWENADDMHPHADGMQTHANALHSHSDNEYAYDNENDNDFDNEFEIVKASQGNTDTPSVSETYASESIYLEDNGIRDEDRMRLSVVLFFSVQSCGHPAFEGIPLRNRHLQ